MHAHIVAWCQVLGLVSQGNKGRRLHMLSLTMQALCMLPAAECM
jgi:hypothetical protein